MLHAYMGRPIEFRNRAAAASHDDSQHRAKSPIPVVALRTATVATRDPAVAEMKGRPIIGKAVNRPGGAERAADE
jgi:hypothetical protein